MKTMPSKYESTLMLLLYFLCNLFTVGHARKSVNGVCFHPNKTKCYPGVVLPVWPVIGNYSTTGDTVARASIYFASLMYMFLGVSIIADRFMASIEVITSKEKEVTIKTKTGEKQVVSVRIWNETVSNLTLMALGSSAPEILLSIIEICGKDFEAGDLGPGTIVGSAAFNLFVIIGLCVIVIPNGQVRRIKHLTVFFITASWSIFAYLWLCLIVKFISKNEVEIWEALLTFAFFPMTVVSAYIADTKIFFRKFLNKKYSGRGIRGYTLSVNENNGLTTDVEMQHMTGNHIDDITFVGANRLGNGDIHEDDYREFEKHRMDYVSIIRNIRKRNPNIDPKQLEEEAQLEILSQGPKSRAFYRMKATRQLTGSGNVIKKAKVEKALPILEEIEIADEAVNQFDERIQKVFFDPGHYTVMENVGTFNVIVTRRGGDLSTIVQVDYETEAGTATPGEDYEHASGTLTFQPGETHKLFPITIVDDDIFEEDEHFSIRLSNLRVRNSSGHMLGSGAECGVQLANPCVATVMILDDDHGGIFHFEGDSVKIPESAGETSIKCIRSSGARGHVRVPYQTIDATAKGNGKDFEHVEGVLDFHNDQSEEFIRVPIVDHNDYEKDIYFYIQLGDPYVVKKHDHRRSFFGSNASQTQHQVPFKGSRADATQNLLPSLNQYSDGHTNNNKRDPEVEELGRPRLGEATRIEVHIVENQEFKKTVDHLLKVNKWSSIIGTSSWQEQFIEAITVSAGNEEEDDEEEKLPSCMDYVMHFLTIFWKVLFAFVPPTDYLNGWICFVVCIAVIGMLTAVIGDLASHFGCTIGLLDSVNAITFVALGTSIPDTFASKVAAINDETADSSIGNVTGSNAVNVFLGIGVAWSIAAIVKKSRGEVFYVSAGSLGFSVTLFCILAFFAITLIVLRRHNRLGGGELGGPKSIKLVCGFTLIGIWLIYILTSSLESYCYIEGF